MCGICGKYYFERPGGDDLAGLLRRMTGSMAHRGPDDEGFYIRNGVGLGHRRLSIIDLSTGKQPIANEDGSVVVVFNGEIYNFESLRDSLLGKGHVFKTRSDTEVLVHSYEEYGEDFLQKLRGMFAFALWDDRNRTLLLARDRLGIKPLYFSTSPDWILFSSEIKGILQDAEFGSPEVNPEAIDSFLRCYFVPGQETIFRKIRRLLPGWYLKVSNGQIAERQYWDLKFGTKYYGLGMDVLKHKLDSLLRETVRGHMLSDVPVGFLLSGGVDSTALLSYAVNETNKNISTFTVGFSGQNFADEREYARMAARKYGTRHFDMTISSGDFQDFLPAYVWHMEELVCEPPAIALHYITKFASDYVKVLISGEGGDEAFAGYPNYATYPIIGRMGQFVGPFRKPLSKVLKYFVENFKGGKYKKYGYVFGEEANKCYYSRTSGPFTLFNERWETIYSDYMKDIHFNNSGFNSIFDNYFLNLKDNSDLDKFLYVDSKTWLPDDLLIKADKITMANSVELRVPFLDHEIMEFAANIPPKYKVNGKTTKFIMKETFKGLIPNEILFRKKTGFPVPYEIWLRNELKASIKDILLDPKSLGRGYFNRIELENIIHDNNGNGSYSKEIFSLLVLEIWHKTFLDNKCVSCIAI
jgi:asparagine synthase (glutamine-hydrolysing)